MQKTMLVTLAIGIGLAGGGTAMSTTAHATTWHKGLPSFLAHKKFHTKYKKEYGTSVTREKITFGKSTFKIGWYQNQGSWKNASYKKSGKYYYVKGKDVYGGTYQTWRFQRVSSTKIKSNFTHFGTLYRY